MTPMPHRVLPAAPIDGLDAYRSSGGGVGLDIARRTEPAAVIGAVTEAGLRGRGGAGFPTGVKWETVAAYGAAGAPAAVVVNGAEGEPGTFKDRAILRRNAHAVLEGALIAAAAVGADRVVVALKASFTAERACVERALEELERAGWADGVGLGVATGPAEYLFGEETGLLEVLDGRPPFPRIAPPFRHGVDEAGFEPAEPAGTDMARPGPSGAPPTLVNNVETLANVPAIVANGPAWFRELGTEESPGTIVCTISGSTRRHGVAEIAMGTTLGQAIERIGGGARKGRTLTAAISGVANPLVPADRFDTPLTHEAMRAAGSGLGAAGFIVFDDADDLASVAAGISRFLAVESCGQCTPCKQDGVALAEALDRIQRSQANDYDLLTVAERAGTVADGARCYLAQQHQLVVESVLRLFPDALRAHTTGAAPARAAPILPILELGDDGVAVLDEQHLGKQPDWTYGDTDSGKPPVERLAEGGPDAT